MMVVPRQHASDFTALDDEAIADAAATLQHTLHALDALGEAKAVATAKMPA